MIERYSRPGMKAIWEDENKYRLWLEVELLAVEAWAELGRIPRSEARALRKQANFRLERIASIEAEVRHDVIAFTTAVAEETGEVAKHIHYGLTSSDVVDTAFSVQLVRAADLILKSLKDLEELLRSRAAQERFTLMMGRTHGIHAEPITLGLKFALWSEEIHRHRERMERARTAVAVGKISGAVGTYANVDPFVEEYVCRHLGLVPAPISNQIVQRDRHAEYLLTLSLIGSSLDKFAQEIRSLQRTEIRELEEPFHQGQKGSSAMPHKRNPVSAEQISGLARVIRGHAVTALENIPLWGERDISHSSAERIIFPDATTLVDYLLASFTRIVRDLHIYRDRMRENLDLTGGLIFSQQVLLGLVAAGLSREEAYLLVQGHAMAAWRGEVNFREALSQDPRVTGVLSESELAKVFDYEPHLQHVDRILARLGIE